jgi:hypothetical protein
MYNKLGIRNKEKSEKTWSFSRSYATLLRINFALLRSSSLSKIRKRIMKLALTTTLLALALAESLVQKNLAQ